MARLTSGKSMVASSPTLFGKCCQIYTLSSFFALTSVCVYTRFYTPCRWYATVKNGLGTAITDAFCILILFISGSEMYSSVLLVFSVFPPFTSKSSF